MNNRQIALKLMLDALGVDPRIETKDDRKRVQKAVYVGQLSGVDLGYRFSWYIMGPYSPDLTKDYYALAEEIDAGDTSWEGKALKPDVVDKIQKVSPLISSPQEFPLDQSDWLELLASYDYLKRVSHKNDTEIDEIFRRQKPRLSSYLKLAKEAYDKLPSPTQ